MTIVRRGFFSDSQAAIMSRLGVFSTRVPQARKGNCVSGRSLNSAGAYRLSCPAEILVFERADGWAYPARGEPKAANPAIAEASEGFVYAISRTGITGTQKTLRSDAQELVAKLRKYTNLPIAVGFGVSNAEHVTALGHFADAAVVGSAIVATIEASSPGEAPAAVARFIKGLRQANPVPVR